MNIDDRIKELEEKQAEISKEIESLKKTNGIKFIPEIDCCYYYLNDKGYISYTIYINDDTDKYRISIGNCFKTAEAAQKHQQNLITYQQLKTLALELNKDKKIDKKNCISIGQIYCCDINFLGKSIEQIGRKKLKQLCEWGI